MPFFCVRVSSSGIGTFIEKNQRYSGKKTSYGLRCPEVGRAKAPPFPPPLLSPFWEETAKDFDWPPGFERLALEFLGLHTILQNVRMSLLCLICYWLQLFPDHSRILGMYPPTPPLDLTLTPTLNLTQVRVGTSSETWIDPFFLCRSLGVHVSKVRSLTLDAWEPEPLKVITFFRFHVYWFPQYIQEWIEGLCEREAYAPISQRFFKLLGIHWIWHADSFCFKNVPVFFFQEGRKIWTKLHENPPPSLCPSPNNIGFWSLRAYWRCGVGVGGLGGSFKNVFEALFPCLPNVFNSFTPTFKTYIIPTFQREMYYWGSENWWSIISKLQKAKFFILCDVIFLVRLQGNFEIDHSWEWSEPISFLFLLVDVRAGKSAGE